MFISKRFRYFLVPENPQFSKPCKLIATNACVFSVYNLFYIHKGAGSVVYLHGGYGDTFGTDKDINWLITFPTKGIRVNVSIPSPHDRSERNNVRWDKGKCLNPFSPIPLVVEKYAHTCHIPISHHPLIMLEMLMHCYTHRYNINSSCCVLHVSGLKRSKNQLRILMKNRLVQKYSPILEYSKWPPKQSLCAVLQCPAFRFP